MNTSVRESFPRPGAAATPWPARVAPDHPPVGYVAPMVIFGAITALEGVWPELYAAIYVAKMCLVTMALVVFRKTLADIRVSRGVLAPAVIVGIFVFVQWIVVDKTVPYGHLGSRSAFNPFEFFHDPAAVAGFLFVRFYGLVLLVPVMEEVFWRSFLLRYLTRLEFAEMPLGAFSWSAFWIVAGCFGVAHPEWLPAIVAACSYALLLKQTRSLFACVTAHAVTNAALGVYVIATGDWQYW